MTRPDYVPEDAEDITDHGITQDHNPNDPDLTTALDVMNAISDAMDAAGNGGSVYIPEGTYYFGKDGFSPPPINAGVNTSAGISWYGDGPTKSTLAWTEHMADDDSHTLIRYSDDATHGNVSVEHLHMDGNWQNLGNLDANGSGSAFFVVDSADSDNDHWQYYNCHFEGSYGRGFRHRAVTFEFDYCTFEEIGVGMRQENTARHVITTYASDQDCYFRDCKWLTIGSDAININPGEGSSTNYHIERGYFEGVGAAILKNSADDPVTISFRNCHMKPYTQNIANLTPESGYPGISPYNGKWGAQRWLSPDTEASIDFQDCLLEDTWVEGFIIRSPLKLTGDNIAIKNTIVSDNADHRDRHGAISAFDSGHWNVDVGEISVHGTDAGNGVAFDVAGSNSSGTVETLHRDVALGSVEDISITNDNPGGDQLQPNVPAPDEVGANETTSTTEPDPDQLFNEWTPQWESGTEDWNIRSSSDYEGGSALVFEPDGSSWHRYALSWDNVGEVSDVEVLDKFRVPSINNTRSICARLHIRSSSGKSGYWIDIDADENKDPAITFRLGKVSNGNWTLLGKFGTPAENTFFYRRFRANGNNLKAKVWPAGESEPSSWDIEVTDEDHSAGWVGLGSFDTRLVENDVFSVATDGSTAHIPGTDTAPSVSWANPVDGQTVSETTTMQIAAGDMEDSDDSLTVEYLIGDSSWSVATYNSETGYYEDTWDSTTVANGVYTLEAEATDSAGNTTNTMIDLTVDNKNIAVESVNTRDVSSSTATLVGDLSSLGTADSVKVSFEWREAGQDSWYSTATQTLSTTGEFTAEVTELSATTDYEFRAIVSTPEEINGGTVAFQTDSVEETDPVPVIEKFDVEDNSNPVWSRYNTDWRVTQEDAELDTVITELRYQGMTVATESSSISGGDVSFSHSLRVRGDVDEIRLSVNDTDNDVTTESKVI